MDRCRRLWAMSDVQIVNASKLKECLDENSIAFPAADPLPNDDQPTPYFILGDEVFGLRTHLMTPCAQRQITKEQNIFSYRLPSITDCLQSQTAFNYRLPSESWSSTGRSSSLRCKTTLRQSLLLHRWTNSVELP